MSKTKGIKGVISLFAEFAEKSIEVQIKQSEELTKLRKHKDIDLEFRKDSEPESRILNRVQTNSFDRIAVILNQMLKQSIYQGNIQKSFYSALMQFLSGDVEAQLEVFRVLGVENKNQLELAMRLEKLLDSGDGLTFISKLFSSSFTDDDLELINKYSPLSKDDLNKVGEWFAVRNTDGKLLSFSEIMLGLINAKGNFR